MKKNKILKYIILAVLLPLTGCSQHSANTPKQTAYTGTKIEKILGTRIACSEKRTEWDYTKEIYGDN